MGSATTPIMKDLVLIGGGERAAPSSSLHRVNSFFWGGVVEIETISSHPTSRISPKEEEDVISPRSHSSLRSFPRICAQELWDETDAWGQGDADFAGCHVAILWDAPWHDRWNVRERHLHLSTPPFTSAPVLAEAECTHVDITMQHHEHSPTHAKFASDADILRRPICAGTQRKKRTLISCGSRALATSG